MFIRSKVVKGQTYYQVVNSYRDSETGRVRHRTVLSLGRESSFRGALDVEIRLLAALRRKRSRLRAQVGWAEPSPKQRRQAESLDRRIAASVDKVGKLQSFLTLDEVALMGTVEDAARKCIVSPAVIRQIRLLKRPENLDLWRFYEEQDSEHTLEGLCRIARGRAKGAIVDTADDPEGVAIRGL